MRLAAVVTALFLLAICTVATYLVVNLPDHFPQVEGIAGSRYRTYGLDANSCWLYFYEQSEGVALAPAEAIADWYRQGQWEEISAQDIAHTEWSDALNYSDRLIVYRGASLRPRADGSLHLITHWSVRMILPDSCR
jgi:hypothetical protein